MNDSVSPQTVLTHLIHSENLFDALICSNFERVSKISTLSNTSSSTNECLL